MLNRRSFLTTSSLAAISLATPGLLGRASAQGAALKIGVPVPISGAFAANGKFATIGAQMAAEEVAKAHGIEVSTLDLDTEGKPATAVRKVQDALAQDGVKLFAGGILSAGVDGIRVAEAVAKTGADASVVYVPPPFAADSILEAIDAEIDRLRHEPVLNEAVKRAGVDASVVEDVYLGCAIP